MIFDWKNYVKSRPDLKTNWDGPMRAFLHYYIFRWFDGKKTCACTYKSLEKNKSKPYMAKEEVTQLFRILKNSTEYFEFGIGGSTIFAYNNTKTKIRGVDSSKAWVTKVKDAINSHSRIKIKYSNIGSIQDFGFPKNRLFKFLWPNYSKSIFRIADKPDTILIDGRFRVACVIQTILFSINRDITPTIILHDSVRSEYDIVFKILNPIKEVKSKCKTKRGLHIFELKHKYDISKLNKIYDKYKYDPR